MTDQGNVRVLCRFRPLNDKEKQMSEQLCVDFSSDQQTVVILIDEYDKPILDNIADPVLATEMREGLKNFYSVIKDFDAHLRFAFLTGVSQFSKVSVFSGLNNLNDITFGFLTYLR